MSSRKLDNYHVRFAAGVLAATLLAAGAALADEPERGVFVLTSTNDPSANEVVVFKLDTSGAPSLSLPDKKWLAVIYGAGGSAYVAVFGVDAYGDLTPAATSSPTGVASFSGVAISE